jgi:hypothetical protein
MSCIAIVQSHGDVCRKKTVDGAERCKVHMKSLENHGPVGVEKLELKAIYHRALNINWRERQGPNAQTELDYLTSEFYIGLIFRHTDIPRRVKRAILAKKADVPEQGDADLPPDVAAEELGIQAQNRAQEIIQRNIARDEAQREREERREQERAERLAQIARDHEENMAQIDMRILAEAGDRAHMLAGLMELRGAVAELRPPAPLNPLAAFAEDRQNIHTQVAVDHAKRMIDIVRKIEVPKDFRWNRTECSKTPGDIIRECRLSVRAAQQMMGHYLSSERIYYMDKGIYGKVLDSVWQYILNSPEKADLVKVLKAEMEDNVGMCAQGNLTRVCNILAGFVDGISQQESPAEMLGREVPKLADIADIGERARRLTEVLAESGLPADKWSDWVSAVFEDGEARVDKKNKRVKVAA